MYGTLITFPSDFATSTISLGGVILTDLSPYLTLVLGVLITGLIVSIIIKSLTK